MEIDSAILVFTETLLVGITTRVADLVADSVGYFEICSQLGLSVVEAFVLVKAKVLSVLVLIFFFSSLLITLLLTDGFILEGDLWMLLGEVLLKRLLVLLESLSLVPLSLGDLVALETALSSSSYC